VLRQRGVSAVRISPHLPVAYYEALQKADVAMEIDHELFRERRRRKSREEASFIHAAQHAAESACAEVIAHLAVSEIKDGLLWLDGRPHASNRIAQYNGDSRGRWEGNTLIVETTNFGKEVYDPSYAGGGMRPNVNGTFTLIERFTRTGPDVLEYQFTINDPTWYTAPFTAKIPMTRNPKPLYEFACHEGNYSLPGILEGARRLEAETAKQRTNPSSR